MSGVGWCRVAGLAETITNSVKLKLELRLSLAISSYDKPFITAELKTLHRKKCREYYKHGKSVKYLSLKRKFDDLYKYETKKYLTKTVN